jgi:hypothetical protein
MPYRQNNKRFVREIFFQLACFKTLPSICAIAGMRRSQVAMNIDERILNACGGSYFISMLMEKACFIRFICHPSKKEFYISWHFARYGDLSDFKILLKYSDNL